MRRRSLTAAFLLALSACAHPRLTSDQPVPAVATAQVDSATTFVREELYFGVKRRGGGEVSPADWSRFLEEVVTPKFPEGLTILEGQGQYRMADQTIVREPTRLIVVLYQPVVASTKAAAIAEITRSYKAWFDQESVLRVTSVVRAAF
jgi:hypothetical protein